MSVYYTPPATVVDGDVAYASDVNDISTATNTAFLGVESAIDDVVLGAQQWADLAEKWATNPEDVPVEPGLYSSWHWSLKATASASAASTSESNAASSASSASTSASNASTSASNASTSEGNAATSASEAAQSAIDAAAEVEAHSILTGTAVHGLGTASTETVTTTDYDETANRILKVGDFGIGATATREVTASNALNNLSGSQTVRVGSTYVITVGGPPRAEHGLCIHTRYSATSAYQVFRTIGGSPLPESPSWYRSQDTGVWDNWRAVYDQENIVGTVSQSGGIPTGAIIETGSNSNGEYTKFADGTMICLVADSVTDQAIDSAYGTLYQGGRVWTFPASFISSPRVTCGLGKWGSGAGWSGTGADPSTSTVLLRFWDVNTRATGTTFIFSATAIGRWF